MDLTLISGLLLFVCLVSSVVVYAFIRSQNVRSSQSPTSASEKQQIKYSFQPSIDIITKKVSKDSSFRSSFVSSKSNQSSSSIFESGSQSKSVGKHRTSIDSICQSTMSLRSSSISNNLTNFRRPRSINWRQTSIIEPNQMAMIEFSVPTNQPGKDRYRRRSVHNCTDLIEPPLNSTSKPSSNFSPCLLSFKLFHQKGSLVKLQLESIKSLPVNIQQVQCKVKLLPEGKEKSVALKKLNESENIFDEQDEQFSVQFSNVSPEKLSEKSLLVTVHGKDASKRSIQLGQIGKIHLNQLTQLQPDRALHLIHQVEKLKPSSIEILVSLEKKKEHYLHVALQRIKGLKVDQKHLDATCYIELTLLDRHRTLTTQQTKSHRLNSTTFNIDEQYDFNILNFDACNLDRFMLAISLFSNSANAEQHRCVAHLKLGPALLCSGSGTTHWQQVRARDSFSMWHTLNKYQHV